MNEGVKAIDRYCYHDGVRTTRPGCNDIAYSISIKSFIAILFYLYAYTYTRSDAGELLKRMGVAFSRYWGLHFRQMRCRSFFYLKHLFMKKMIRMLSTQTSPYVDNASPTTRFGKFPALLRALDATSLVDSKAG